MAITAVTAVTAITAVRAVTAVTARTAKTAGGGSACGSLVGSLGGRGAAARSGFSLIELLTTIAIIALVVAITIPAIGYGRNAARRSSSEALLASIQQAIFQFKLDNKGNIPGYFSAADMGSSDNRDRGMSAMENAMLSLAGGVVAAAGPSTVQVGPINSAANQISVDLTQIGQLNSRERQSAYFTPTGANFIAQTTDGAASIGQNASVSGHADSNGTRSIPDVVDAFGTPILLWVADGGYGSGGIRYDAGNAGPNNFMRANSQTLPAVYYYNSNRCFLTANRIGKKFTNQVDGNKGSIFAPAASTADPTDAQLTNLAAVLGSPSFPGDLTAATRTMLPSATRGDFVLMSAGADAIYAGRGDKGAKQGEVTGSDARIYFGQNFKTLGGDTLTDDRGRTSSRDLASLFDDIVVAGG